MHQANKNWKPPPKPLPPLHEILRSAVQEPGRPPGAGRTERAKNERAGSRVPALPSRGGPVAGGTEVAAGFRASRP